MNLTFHTPTRWRFGDDCSQELGESVRNLGASRVLVVTDAGLVRAGVVDPLEANLQASGVEPIRFDQVEANPTVATVHTGIDTIRERRCEAVVAIGGGSPIDAGKAMAVLAAHHGPATDFEHAVGSRAIERAGLPLITVPTTAGTGSEVTCWSVITDTVAKRKFDIGSPLMAPRTALVDPLLTLGLPPRITAATGMDALTHAIEAFTTTGRYPMTQGIAAAAIRLIDAHIETAVADGSDRDARRAMAHAATAAGFAFPNTGLGAVHGLTAPIGGHLDAPHGDANACLLPWVMAWNAETEPAIYAAIARLLGWNGDDDTAGARFAIDRVVALNAAIGIPDLADLGVTEALVDRLAADAIGPHSNCNANPRPISLTEAAGLLRRALKADRP